MQLSLEKKRGDKVLWPTGPACDPDTADPDSIDKYYKIVNLKQEVACLMLSSMSPDLQRTLEKYNAYDMLKELKTMFEEQAKHELFETAKAFHACKHEEGYVMLNELGVSLILNSLNKDYDQFIQNYNMHSMGKTIAELHAMLKLYKKGILKKAETPGYPKETMGYYFYYPLENKIFVARNAEFFENSLIIQEASRSHGLLESSGSDGGLELIQEEGTQPSENTSEIHNEVAPIEVEPQNVKVLVDLLPSGETIRSKWLFKKKTDMDGEAAYILGIKIIHDRSKRAIDWKSARKITIAMSSTEAEYIAAAEASMEGVRMRKFIDGLGGVMPSNKRPMEMQCHNEPAIAIANDPGILKGSRHFQRKYHYIHEVIQERKIFLKKVHTYDNVADPFIKPMSYNKHYEHAMMMELIMLEVSCKFVMYSLVFG
nr:hypothetical protein [Tanacetum cinerariifolium]